MAQTTFSWANPSPKTLTERIKRIEQGEENVPEVGEPSKSVYSIVEAGETLTVSDGDGWVEISNEPFVTHLSSVNSSDGRYVWDSELQGYFHEETLDAAPAAILNMIRPRSSTG